MPTYARTLRLDAHSGQGGRPDGAPLIVHRGYGHVGHVLSKGFSVLDPGPTGRARSIPPTSSSTAAASSISPISAPASPSRNIRAGADRRPEGCCARMVGTRSSTG